MTMSEKERIFKEALLEAFESDMERILKETKDLPEHKFSEDFERKMVELLKGA